ncbi:Calmodulin [Spironucleus salmonicida]|uniref:Calmodulin n=1 Tax=Spironucleus salmonicida TaxID=348837 RepID=V6LY38_9EUKA|nr:Calmodulin [Spironucleus salmonicida]|eukprot:EST48636.1 Calmodulin [Spironucleus salmonicida]
MDDIPTDVIVEFLDEYREAFNAFNISKSGKIQPDEIDRIMHILNQQPTRGEIADILETFCQSQEISFINFTKLLVNSSRNYDQEATIRDVFLCFDRNGDGMVNASELQFVLQQLGIPAERQELEDLCNEFGGEISFKDFALVFCRFEV